jgi:fumarylpyruvate hydrolase
VGLAARFPVHRVYCVGRNYADHVAEMGGDPKSEPPVFFSKPASALVTDGDPVRYPQATTDLHHEVELVVALAEGGRDLSMSEAAACIFGYGVGIDFTRRDLQTIAKKHGRPWDTAKGFDQSAPLSALTSKTDFAPSTDTVISLSVNGESRQSATLGQMIWHVAEIIQQLSMLFELKAGDIIYTGTPAGVAAVVKGDKLCAEVSGLSILDFEII